MTLLEPFEVVRYAGVKATYELVWICSILDSEEFAFFNEYMTPSAYDCFLSKRIDYGVLKSFNCDSDICIGCYIEYCGEVYKRINNTNCSNTPVNDSDYELANRFDDEKLEEIWRKYLRGILALKVCIASIPQSTFQASAKGITALVDTNDGMRGASKTELNMLIDSLQQRLFNKVEMLNRFLKINYKDIPCVSWRNELCGESNGSPLKQKYSGENTWHLI